MVGQMLKGGSRLLQTFEHQESPGFQLRMICCSQLVITTEGLRRLKAVGTL
jgi:hypothetical protein